MTFSKAVSTGMVSSITTLYDTVGMVENYPHLTTQKSFYVEISRARDRAELVTDDAKALREQLGAVIGE